MQKISNISKTCPRTIKYITSINNIYYYRRRLSHFDAKRLNLKEIKRSLHTSDYREAIANALALERQLFMSKKDDVIHVIQAGDFKADFGGDKDKDAAQQEFAAYELYMQRQRDMAGIVKTPVKPAEKRQEHRLSDLIPLYIDEHKDEWRDAAGATLKRHQSELDLFMSIAGDKDVNDITNDDCMKYQTLLRKWPSAYKSDRHGDIHAYIQNHGGDKIIEAKHQKKRNNYVIEFLKWCKTSQGKYLTGDIPLVTLSAKKQKTTVEKYPFSDNHLTAIFKHETWTRDRYTNDLHYWAPLLASYTGMRPKEICQLYKTDIAQDIKHGWIIYIRDTEEKGGILVPSAKSLKTGEERAIPLNKELIDLGFLEFVDKTTTKELFPITFKRDYCDPKTMTSRFNANLLPKLLDKTVNYSFYSFRHRFKDYAGGLGMSGDAIEILMGHSSMRAKMGKTYGDKLGLEITTRAYHDKFTWQWLLEECNVKPWRGFIKNGLK